MHRLYPSVVLLLLLALCNDSAAQDTLRQRFFLTTQPLQYVFADFPFKAEYRFGRQTVGVLLGYRPATQKEGNGTLTNQTPGGYTDINMFNKLYNAYTVGLSSKRYYGTERRNFIEGELFYRHWWFKDKDCNFSQEKSYSFSGRRTENQDVYGFKFLIGTTWGESSPEGGGVVVETFMGLGYRVKTHLFETWDGTVGTAHYNYFQEEQKWGEDSRASGFSSAYSLQLGLRIGIGK